MRRLLLLSAVVAVLFSSRGAPAKTRPPFLVRIVPGGEEPAAGASSFLLDVEVEAPDRAERVVAVVRGVDGVRVEGGTAATLRGGGTIRQRVRVQRPEATAGFVVVDVDAEVGGRRHATSTPFLVRPPSGAQTAPPDPMVPGAPLPGAPLPGAPLPGAPLPGAPLPGAPLPGAPRPTPPRLAEPAPDLARPEALRPRTDGAGRAIVVLRAVERRE